MELTWNSHRTHIELTSTWGSRGNFEVKLCLHIWQGEPGREGRGKPGGQAWGNPRTGHGGTQPAGSQSPAFSKFSKNPIKFRRLHLVRELNKETEAQPHVMRHNARLWTYIENI